MRHCLLPLLSLVIASLALAAPVRSAEPARLEAALAAAPREAHVGVSAVGLETGRVYADVAATRAFTPASTLKLLVAAASLSRFGAAHRFETALLSDGPVSQGRLDGPLYVVGGGDPLLAEAGLANLVRQLQARGIRRVTGGLVLDAGRFRPESPVADGVSWDDMGWGYGAPVSALSFHENTLTVTLVPAGRAEAPARLGLAPVTPYAQVLSAVTTADRTPGPAAVVVDAHEIEAAGERWRLSGTVAAPETLRLSVAHPPRWAAAALAGALGEAGVQLDGPTREGATPPAARVLARHASAPLADLVVAMNKASNNLVADTLLLQLGAHAAGAPGTRASGLAALAGFVEGAGWDRGAYTLADGAGLSRYNLVTPAQLTRLLRHVASQPRAYGPFLISLPVAGRDGTLAARLDGSPARGLLRAKTGTMGGVSALAGYMERPGKEPLAVAVMLNGVVGPLAPARRFQDALVEALLTLD